MIKLSNDRRRLNYKLIKTISPTTMKRGSCRMTVGKFVENWNKGTYIIVISRHAFTVRDGEVIGGNSCDASRMRCVVKGVWKIG